MLLFLTAAKDWLGMGRGSGVAWAGEVAWHGLWFGLPRSRCFPKIKKLLEFDFSTAIDRAVKDEAAEIGAVAAVP